MLDAEALIRMADPDTLVSIAIEMMLRLMTSMNCVCTGTSLLLRSSRVSPPLALSVDFRVSDLEGDPVFSSPFIL